MAIELRQQGELALEQRISLQLQQAIKLLRLSRLELQEYLANEILENPFLEELAVSVDDATVEVTGEEFTQQELVEHLHTQGDSWVDHQLLDLEKYQGGQESIDFTKPKGNVSGESSDVVLEQTAIYHVSAWDHLLAQFSLLNWTAKERRIANEIGGNLDSRGYLVLSVEDLAFGLQEEVAEVEKVRQEIQRLEPLGLASMNLADCLICQLDEMHIEDDLARTLLTSHIDLLENRRYKVLMKLCGVSRDELMQSITTLRQLDPFPGKRFHIHPQEGVIVDLVLKKVGADWVVILNEEGLPQLSINAYYRDHHVGDRDRSTKKYFGQKLRAAKWVVSSVMERQKLLLRVGQEIMRSQVDFLEQGVKHMKPLRLKDVAEQVGCDPSTVSRLTTQKYAQTPRGTFELKYFFTNALQNTDGNMVTTKSIRARIRELIDQEDPAKPYSDHAITKLLLAEGLQIARRTVAKYRESLGFPSSSQRAHRDQAG
ncbi:MAG: RNA polymerase factor sigma-54 [Zetaproteobacteria bacterium]|nr:RNA polymerase factor sigma-54 [Zetaproteobacteria bacterium]